MGESIDIVEELLGMAKDPAPFSKNDMAELVLVAATEIIKLRQFPPVWLAAAERSGSPKGLPSIPCNIDELTAGLSLQALAD